MFLNFPIHVRLYIFLYILSVPRLTMAQDNCELRKDKDHIRIYSCPVVNSPLRAIRVEFDVNTTMAKYISIVTDITNYNTWRHHELNHKLLKRISSTELIFYAEISAPFPLSNRDVVSHLTITQDSTTKVLTAIVESIPDYLPPVNGIIRVPKSRSIMKLTQVNNSTLKAVCYIEADPGGQIPAWVVNSFSTQTPFDTFRNLILKLEARS